MTVQVGIHQNRRGFALITSQWATTEYSELRRVTGKLAAAVVIGGEGFRDRTLRERFPSEFYGEDFAGLSKFVRALAKKKA